MRVIIVSESSEHRTRLRRQLAVLVPDVEVTEYDPAQNGRPSPGFDWSLYEVLFLDECVGSESGLSWLLQFACQGHLPPAVLVLEDGDEFVATRVAGVDDVACLARSAIDAEGLAEVLGRLGVSLTVRPRPQSLNHLLFGNDREVMRRLAPGSGDDGYRFVRLIGQGAQSRVYLAERLGDGQTLVLKVLELGDLDDHDAVQRFAREAALLASIDSPYVIRFHDHGFTPSYGYIAVEFFSRGDLKQRIEQGITPDDAALYALNIAYGLAAIHAQGIVHRDLKPGNIMFRGDGSLALADFGISRHLNDSWGLTSTGAVVGTLSYLSPEQGLGRPIDHRTDLYALGMVLFEMLTGEVAFRAHSPGALVYQHLHAPVPTLPAHLARFQPVLERLLAKDPAERYADARDVIAALGPCTTGVAA